jgi:hypothetical protein
MAPRRTPAQYLLLTSSRSFDAVRQSLAQRVRVLAGGEGTVEVPSAMWFEVTRRGPQEPFPALFDLRAALTPSERIFGVQPVTEGEGRNMARQASLLSSCGEGLWREAVSGGGERPIEPEKPGTDSSAEQMPLFG